MFFLPLPVPADTSAGPRQELRALARATPGLLGSFLEFTAQLPTAPGPGCPHTPHPQARGPWGRSCTCTGLEQGRWCWEALGGAGRHWEALGSMLLPQPGSNPASLQTPSCTYRRGARRSPRCTLSLAGLLHKAYPRLLSELKRQTQMPRSSLPTAEHLAAGG